MRLNILIAVFAGARGVLAFVVPTRNNNARRASLNMLESSSDNLSRRENIRQQIQQEISFVEAERERIQKQIADQRETLDADVEVERARIQKQIADAETERKGLDAEVAAKLKKLESLQTQGGAGALNLQSGPLSLLIGGLSGIAAGRAVLSQREQILMEQSARAEAERLALEAQQAQKLSNGVPVGPFAGMAAAGLLFVNLVGIGVPAPTSSVPSVTVSPTSSVVIPPKTSSETNVATAVPTTTAADAAAIVTTTKSVDETEKTLVTKTKAVDITTTKTLAKDFSKKVTATMANNKIPDATLAAALATAGIAGAAAVVASLKEGATKEGIALTTSTAASRAKTKGATNPMGGYLDNMSSVSPASSSALSVSFPATTVTNPMGGYLDNMSGATAASSSFPSLSSPATTLTNPMGSYLDSMSSATLSSSSASSASSPATTATNPMGGYLENMSSATAVSSSAQSVPSLAMTATNPMGGYLENMRSATADSTSSHFASSPAKTLTNPMGSYLENMSTASPASIFTPSTSSPATTATNPVGGFLDKMRSVGLASSSALFASSPATNLTNPMGTYLDNMRGATPASSIAPSASSPVTTSRNPMGGYLENMSSATAVSSSAQSASSPAMTATNPMGGYLESMSSAIPVTNNSPSKSFPATIPTNPMGGYLENMRSTTAASSIAPTASSPARTAARSMGGYWDNMSSATPVSTSDPSAPFPATTATVSRTSSVSSISNARSGELESKATANLKQKYEADAMADVISRKPVFENEPKVGTVDISVPFDVIQDLYQYLDNVQKDKNRPSVWMPRPLELSNMGRGDLAQAIESFGGFNKICKLAGLVPFQDWYEFEGEYELLLELRNYLNSYHGGDQTYFPPESDMKRHGYDQLCSLVQFYGGSESLANRLGMSSKNSPRRDADLNWGPFSIDTAIELYRFVRADQMKEKGPMRRPVISIPSQRDLLANGQGRLHQSIMDAGGYESVARRLGLDFWV